MTAANTRPTIGMLAFAAAVALAGHAAAETAPAAKHQAAQSQLRPHIATLVVSAQDKLRVADVPGAVADLDRVMMAEPTPFELGLTLTVRGGALYTQGDLQGARSDWTRALAEGALDTTTQLHLVQNIELLDGALR